MLKILKDGYLRVQMKSYSMNSMYCSKAIPHSLPDILGVREEGTPFQAGHINRIKFEEQ